LYLNYNVDLSLLHTGRSELVWELYKWRTNFDCSLLMSSTLLWSNKIWDRHKIYI